MAKAGRPTGTGLNHYLEQLRNAYAGKRDEVGKVEIKTLRAIAEAAGQEMSDGRLSRETEEIITAVLEQVKAGNLSADRINDIESGDEIIALARIAAAPDSGGKLSPIDMDLMALKQRHLKQSGENHKALESLELAALRHLCAATGQDMHADRLGEKSRKIVGQVLGLVGEGDLSAREVNEFSAKKILSRVREITAKEEQSSREFISLGYTRRPTGDLTDALKTPPKGLRVTKAPTNPGGWTRE